MKFSLTQCSFHSKRFENFRDQKLCFAFLPPNQYCVVRIEQEMVLSHLGTWRHVERNTWSYGIHGRTHRRHPHHPVDRLLAQKVMGRLGWDTQFWRGKNFVSSLLFVECIIYHCQFYKNAFYVLEKFLERFAGLKAYCQVCITFGWKRGKLEYS